MVIIQEDRILRANHEFSRIFGYSSETCLGSTLYDLIVPEGRMHECEMLMHTVETEGRASIETVRRTNTGELMDVSIVVTPVRLGAGRSGHAVTYRDIRKEKQLQARLQHSALHDPLTGLANRMLFLDRLALTMARLRRRPDRNFAVIFLDLDRFKQVNDTWGHAAGDALLLAVAERLRACLRPQDTVARTSIAWRDAFNSICSGPSRLVRERFASPPVWALRWVRRHTTTSKTFCGTRMRQCTAPRRWAGRATNSLWRRQRCQRGCRLSCGRIRKRREVFLACLRWRGARISA
jgi:PAS domain S-box-containing protein